MMKNLLVKWGLWLFCWAPAVTAIGQSNLSSPLPLDPKVKIGKLANGLTYYIRENKKPENKVELRLVVNAGSILEDKDQQGLAHFTEHMAFNGTKHFKKNELVSFLQSIGVDFGADLNAYTGFDETVYILPIPLSDPNNFKKGMLVLQDWAGGLSFEPKQIDDERGVVLEESRSGKGADDRMFRKIYPLQYAGSQYAVRLPIGKDSLLKTFKHEALKRFYRDWYRPNLMAVVVVGDIDAKATEAMIQEYFGGLKNPPNPRPRPSFPLKARTQSSALVVTDKEATNFQLALDYSPVKEKPVLTLGDYRQEYLVKKLFTSMFNQRLSELAQSSNPPFTYAGVNFGSFARGFEAFSVFAIPGKAGPDTALQAVVSATERVKKFGFTAAELERVKKQELAGSERLYNNRDKTESGLFVEEYIQHFLQQEPMVGIENEYAYRQQWLDGIGLSDVNALANQLKENENFFASLQGPQKSDFVLPASTALVSKIEAAKKLPVEPYVEKVLATNLLKKAPVAGKLVSESKNENLGTTEWTFSNGTKVVIKPTTFKQDEIVLTGFRKGGTSAYGVADKFSANYASAVVGQMGYGDFNPTDLRKVLAGKNAGARVNLSGLSVGVSGNATVKDFETMLQLLYLSMTAPRKDEALFTAWRDKQKSQVQFMMADPTTAFVDSMFKTLYGGNPLAPSAVPVASDFDQIKLDRSLEIYQSLLADASDFTFILVGNIDPEKAKPLLEQYIGGLPSKGGKGVWVDNGVRTMKGVKSLTVQKGKEQKSFVLNVYSGEVEYSEDLAFQTEILTEILNIKIIEDLREKIGGIYGGGIGGSVSQYPYGSYSLGLQLPCGPEKADALKKAAAAEIESIKTKGPEQKDLDKVKKSLMEKHLVNIKENRFWTGFLQG
ncbi:MAG: insulinase family protein, partial [Sphingobacteriia bacterium]